MKRFTLMIIGNLGGKGHNSCSQGAESSSKGEKFYLTTVLTVMTLVQTTAIFPLDYFISLLPVFHSLFSTQPRVVLLKKWVSSLLNLPWFSISKSKPTFLKWTAGTSWSGPCLALWLVSHYSVLPLLNIFAPLSTWISMLLSLGLCTWLLFCQPEILFIWICVCLL